MLKPVNDLIHWLVYVLGEVFEFILVGVVVLIKVDEVLLCNLLGRRNPSLWISDVL